MYMIKQYFLVEYPLLVVENMLSLKCLDVVNFEELIEKHSLIHPCRFTTTYYGHELGFFVEAYNKVYAKSVGDMAYWQILDGSGELTPLGMFALLLVMSVSVCVVALVCVNVCACTCVRVSMHGWVRARARVCVYDS